MNIFGIGFGEVALIIIVALILVGPRRLPETAAHLGRTVRTLRRYAAAVTAQVKEEFADLEAEYQAMKEETEETKRGLRDVSAEMQEEAKGLEQDIDRSAADINRAIAQEPIDSTARPKEDEAGESRPANIVPIEKRPPPPQPQQ
ncbi:MAG: Sec-independent protein translocase protein TatB [Dehalococcoidia bacterium]